MIISDITLAKKGDILLFEPTRLLSRLQVWGDNLGQKRKFNFSHGAVYLGNGKMIESVSKCGVHITKVQKWSNYTIVRPLGKKMIKITELESYLNSRYDFSKIRAVMLNRVFNIPLTVDDDRQVICTELVNLAYGYTLTQKGMCTPVALANAIL